MCEIPFRYWSGSCEFRMSTAADYFFFFRSDGINYHFVVKFSILWLLGTWLLALCPLALLPASTFSFLQFSVQLGIHLITVNIPHAVYGYRYQGVKEQKMNSTFQSKTEKTMIRREGEKKTWWATMPVSQVIPPQPTGKRISELAHVGNTMEAKIVGKGYPESTPKNSSEITAIENNQLPYWAMSQNYVNV